MPCQVHGMSSGEGCLLLSPSPVKELRDSRSRLQSPFSLSDSFLAAYANRTAPFGYDGLGEFVYRRTYSRVKPDGSHENWPETVARVVCGTFRMQQRWMVEQQLRWDAERAQDEAQDMYERIFSMKFLPPGRGLWAMGTALTEERFLYAALNNCAFVSTKDMATEPIKPFTFLMDASMLGVGVGFDTRGAGSFTVPGPSSDPAVAFVVPDSREGWVEAFGQLLRSHFCGTAPVTFDVSLVRPAGEPIRGFGGVSSGPGNLLDLLNTVDSRLASAAGQEVSTTLIVDLMNLIGKCVVSANVRRTAEIAFGDPHDDEYVDLKNYEKNPERAEFGWTSNNSVFAPLGMDYTKICDAVTRNGEPGFCWLDNMQKYDRMNGIVTNTDHKAMGGNPCLEQTLEPFEMCCLVETFPFNHDSLEDYKRTLQAAFLYAKTVTLGQTHWSETASVMARNRRIGTSMSGIAQFVTSRGLHELQKWCETGYAHLKVCDQRLATRFAVPKSIKITSIKPSGTVSLLAGATPGIHYPISRFYIRRVRLPDNSDLLPSLIAAGLEVEPAASCPGTSVVSFVVDAGEGIRNQADVSMWEQLSLAAFLQKHWADNQVSCTVSFDPEKEGPQLARALDIFQYQLKGVSFLPSCPMGAFAQMPYEEITEEEYKRKTQVTKPIQYAKDLLACDPAPELFCDGDKCTMA